MVSNAELLKLITEFKQEQHTRHDTLTKANEDGRRELSEKLDKFGERFDAINERLDKIEENNITVDRKLEELEGNIAVVNQHRANDVLTLQNRVAELERRLQTQETVIPKHISALDDRIKTQETDVTALDNRLQTQETDIPKEIGELKELVESRTNRQLRKTVIFKNIEETKDDESYEEVKELLARTISDNTDLPYDQVFNGIDRAHREAPRRDGNRQGKRWIYAAFLYWELSQQVIDKLRDVCIRDRTFTISADQMYGPITTRRRNLAFQERKKLKDMGVITSAYVSFPAKLMVNIPGDIGPDGKKLYKLHTNFSTHNV